MELIVSRTTTDAPRPHALPRVVRCACTVCGAHTNAVRTVRVTGSCSNCGSYDLSPVDGAEPLSGPVAA